MIRKNDALNYHSEGRKGKIEVKSTKPCATQRDLSLAYTPGVAEPCREIEKNPEDAYKYTAKGNLVAVVTNGSAVLGLGNIGPLAGKPVMEGKGVLFKRFGDVDVFDIELNSQNPEDIIQACKLLEPTFGGINLEDIKAPDCFHIEETLIEEMNIPVFHDDQHGTAIISGAALINALEIVNKKIEEVKVVFNGAGAAGIACAKLYVALGVSKKNILLCDSRGVIYKGREKGMNKYKEDFAVETEARTLEEAFAGADVFCGVSVADCVTSDMVKSMNKNPIVFAMANPDPEITYDDAVQARNDIIMATGRSDFPNQVNNVLGFPFIFRGALDVRAKAINMEMKMAASYALAKLAKEPIPDSVKEAYSGEQIEYGPEYIIPKPFDPRVLLWVAPAVAKTAIDTGVARKTLDMGKYHEELEARLGRSEGVMRAIYSKAKSNPKRIVFPEGNHPKILHSAQILVDEKIAEPILLGEENYIMDVAKAESIDLTGIKIIDPSESQYFDRYVDEFLSLRQRRGITSREAVKCMRDKTYFGSMMVRMNDADGFVCGLTQHYPDTIKPALEVCRLREGISQVSGLYIMIFEKRILFLADTHVNTEPNEEELAEIAMCSAEVARDFDIEPRIAMLSFSNFGSAQNPKSNRVARAVEIVRNLDPDLMIDGEMQADTAIVPEIIEKRFPFSTLKKEANVLIFPDLQSGNISYKLLRRLAEAEGIGPILMGMNKAVHVLQPGSDVNEIVHMAAFAVVDAQQKAIKAKAKMEKAGE